jgi:hypothetical protein
LSEGHLAQFCLAIGLVAFLHSSVGHAGALARCSSGGRVILTGLVPLFMLVNSMAGLAGHFSGGQSVPSFVWTMAGAAVAAGAVGSHLGSRRIHVRTVSGLPGMVLLIARLKLIFTAS